MMYYIRHNIAALQLGFRRISAAGRALPNCFILGAIKGGTTSLAAYLGYHPNYIAAFTKEVNFLHELPNTEKSHEVSRLSKLLHSTYERGGLLAYKKYFPFESQLRSVVEKNGGPAYTGDHTPYNFYCSIATSRIKEICPDAKLIILLRNPVDRAYSHYVMNRQIHESDSRSFDEAISDELQGVEQGIKTKYLYCSTYHAHIKRIYDEFPHQNILIVKSEDFFERTSEVTNLVFQFLELPPLKKNGNLPVHHKGRYKANIPIKTRLMLEDYFQQHNEQLYNFLSKDFKWQQ